jgi:NAD(P)-dependent dehydrogenase (short-subunit alcohol dehydrogenase family)
MFAGKTALITGGGSGIGRSLALALSGEGANVVVADLREDAAQAVADEIKGGGGQAIGIACDVSDFNAVKVVKERANAAFGVVSYLFANAGATTLERITDLTPRDFAWITEVNVYGVSNFVQAFVPDMIAQKSGHVVATSSMAGLIPGWLPLHVPYSTSKAGVIGMMFSLRLELAPHGIGSTVLCPGAVITNIASAPRYRPDRFGGPQDKAMKAPPAGFTLAQPMGPPRTAEETALMTLAAVRQNRAIVLTDATLRDFFMRSYVDEVLTAFDDAVAFDAAKVKR